MDELIGRLVANVGIERNVAEKAVIIILQFLQKEAPEQAPKLIGALPGAEAAIAAAPPSGGGFEMGGVMGAGTKLMGIGLSMGQVQGVTRETLAFAREKAGEEVVGEVVGAIPGLSQFA